MKLSREKSGGRPRTNVLNHRLISFQFYEFIYHIRWSQRSRQCRWHW